MKTFSSLRAAVTRVNRWTIALTSFSMVWLIGCDDWFHDDRKRNAVTDAISADTPDTPWKIDSTPDGRLLVTQRPASITSIKDGHKENWLRVPAGIEGKNLLEINALEFSPDIPTDNSIQNSFVYSYPQENKRPQGLIIRSLEKAGRGGIQQVATIITTPQ